MYNKLVMQHLGQGVSLCVDAEAGTCLDLADRPWGWDKVWGSM